MREILFRAWDKQRQEYLSGGELFIAIQPGKNPKNIQYLDALKNPDMYKDRFELEQFTGLLDKSGKKIFEGDVLAREGYWGIRIEHDLGGLVVRDFDIVRYINQCTNSSLRHYPNLSEYEVISNIHDNPELLEGAEYERD